MINNSKGMFMERNPPKTLYFARIGTTYRFGRVSTTDSRVGSRGNVYREGDRIKHLDLQTKQHHLDLAVDVDKEKFLGLMRESIAVNRESLPSLVKQNSEILGKIGVTFSPGIVVKANSSPDDLVDAITGGYKLVTDKLFPNMSCDPETFRAQARERLIFDSKFHPYINNRQIGDRSHVTLAHEARSIVDFHPLLKQAVFASAKWCLSQRMISRRNSKLLFHLPSSVSQYKLNIEDSILKPQETEFITLIRNYVDILDRDGPLKLTHPECKDLILKLA